MCAIAEEIACDGGKCEPITFPILGILRHLHCAGGHVSKQPLLSGVWGYNPSGSSHTLKTHIYRLRQKIEADPYDARLLLTVAGVGYQMASAEVAG